MVVGAFGGHRISLFSKAILLIRPTLVQASRPRLEVQNKCGRDAPNARNVRISARMCRSADAWLVRPVANQLAARTARA